MFTPVHTLLSMEAQQIIANARTSATADSKGEIDVNDLLAAAKKLSEKAGGEPVGGASAGAGADAGGIFKQPLTENARRVVDVARSRATQHGHQFIGTEDLLRALFEAPESMAIKHLTEKGIDKDVVWGVRTFTDNAQTVVDKARMRAKENAHQFIGTEDLLWAMFNAPTVEGRAVVHMMQRGITKDGVWGVHQYTPNVHKVLDLALERAEGANQTTIGTEDLLWAIFHNPSMNSRALNFLESKGITKGSVWGMHRFSDNVNKVLKDARKAAETDKKLVIGTEDLLRGTHAAPRTLMSIVTLL
jgi:ATP-dependent Clp protease ATP-binding subunit ClpA